MSSADGGLRITVIVGSIGYRRLLTTLIRTAIPSATIEEVDPFSQTIHDSGIAFGINCDVFVLGDIGTEVDAFSALQRLRERENCPPIIVLASHDLESHVSRFFSAGAAAVLLKDALSQKTLGAEILRLANRVTTPAISIGAPRGYGHFPIQVEGESLVLAIEGFRLLATMSASPMAQVMLAESIDDQQRVVIKLPLSTPYHDATGLRQFCERYEYFSSLVGRGVVRYLDAGIAGSWPYVVLEYLPAGDLSARLANGLALDAALKIFHQLVLALVDVHRGGFVHLDLKPENIFFRSDDTLVLIDFNISTRVGRVTRNPTSGEVMGSPFYMSPEQGRGALIDQRSDLYSAGVIFFEMLTGERPFSGDNSAHVIFNHLHQEIPLLPKPIRHLQPILDRMLAKNPEERFVQASEIADALTPLLNQQAADRDIRASD